MSLVVPALIVAALASPLEVFGAGTKSCANWTRERRMPDDATQGWGRLVLETWVLGFVTARGGEDPAAGAGAKAAGPDGMFSFLDAWCGAHPTFDLSEAAQALTNSLEGKK